MKKEILKKYGMLAGKIMGWAGILLMPVVSYVLFEAVTGNLGTISSYMAGLNVAWIYVLYIAVFLFSGSSRITVPVVSLFLLALSMGETFVVAFRNRPIMLWDVLALGTAMTVSGNYEFVISEAMKEAVVILTALNVVLWFAPVRIRGWRLRLGALAAGAGAIGVFAYVFFASIVPGWMLGINMWEVNSTYQEYGYVLSTAVSLQYVVKKPPTGYSQAKVRSIYDAVAEKEEGEAVSGDAAEGAGEGTAEEAGEKAAEERIQPVNLICIMNESLSELQAAGDFTTNIEYFPFLNRLQENTVRGSLCMPVFGSMTSNSEFEFLTGDSMAVLPSNSIAYQFNVKPETYSMVSTLKDQGYETIAMHPYPGANWNRQRVYENMGFDAFLDEEYYEGSAQLRNYVSDRADYEKLIQAVEEKDNPEDRLFIFNVTMQNHGGYEGEYDNFQQQVWLTGEMEGKYPKADQYLSLMKESDEALQYLLEYFQAVEEPTMIVMFGDHQPSVEDEFYDEIAGIPSSEVAAENHLMWYETPFIIWTNYSQPSGNMGKLGAVYLSSQVLELAGLELTPYNRFLLNMAENLPVVHFLGCYDREGNYYSWSEAESPDCPYRNLVLDYEALVYNHSLDRKKVREMFTLRE